MQSPIFLPEQVLRSIRDHVIHIQAQFKTFYESASEDEDTLTGDFLGHLRSTQTVTTDNPEIGRTWVWKIRYTKLRGRGPKPTENIIGADGILELEVDQQGDIQRKAALFQAKMGSSNQSLVEQLSKLLTWREAAFVLKYSSEGCVGLS